MEHHSSVVYVRLSEAGDRCVWIVRSRHHASAAVPQHVVRQAIRDSVRVRSVQQLSSQLLPRPLRDKQYPLLDILWVRTEPLFGHFYFQTSWQGFTSI